MSQNFKNFLQDKMTKELEKSIEDIQHTEEIKKVAEQLYMKWYHKNLLPFDYAEKDDFIIYFTEKCNKYWEQKND